MRRIWFVLAFLVSFLVVSSSQAILPVLVYSIARQAIIMTAETVAIQVVAKGFAANDPYVRTTATIPSSTLAKNISKLRGPRWVGVLALLATVAGFGWDYDDEVGLYVPQKSLPSGGVCLQFPSETTADGCLHAGMAYLKIDTAYPLNPYQIPCSSVPNACPGVVIHAQWCSGEAAPTDTWCPHGAVVAQYRYIQGEEEVFKLPVTEKDINEKLLPAIVASPNTIGDMFAGATQQQLETLLDGATIPYSPTKPSPEMEQLKADYRQGLLQSVDPNAPHYVTPELLKQIQDMVAAEDAANTDDGTVDALNEKMKQPITQAQYEESNKKYADAVNAITDSLPSNEKNESDIDDSFNKLDEIITDIPNATLPSPANIQLPSYSECMTLSLTDGNGHNLVFPSGKQCEKINEMKRMFGYFLALAVAFALCWQLLNRPHG